MITRSRMLAAAIATAGSLGMTPAEAQSAKLITADNHCAQPLRLILVAKGKDGLMRPKGWYPVPAGDAKNGSNFSLKRSPEEEVRQYGQFVGVYAETVSGPPRTWSGPIKLTVRGKEYGFRSYDLSGGPSILFDCRPGAFAYGPDRMTQSAQAVSPPPPPPPPPPLPYSANNSQARKAAVRATVPAGAIIAPLGRSYLVTERNSVSDGQVMRRFVHTLLVSGSQGDRFKVTLRSQDNGPPPSLMMTSLISLQGVEAERIRSPKRPPLSTKGFWDGYPDASQIFELQADGRHMLQINQSASKIGQSGYVPIPPEPYTVLVERLAR